MKVKKELKELKGRGDGVSHTLCEDRAGLYLWMLLNEDYMN